NIEGAGKAGCSAHPQPRVQIKKHTSKSPQVRRNNPAFPARWFTAYGRALLGVHDLLVTVARAMREHRRALNTSQGVSGPHVFAVRIGAARLATPLRPPHPASRLVTIAIRPSASEAGCTTHTSDSSFCKTEIFLRGRIDRNSLEQPVGQIRLQPL